MVLDTHQFRKSKDWFLYDRELRHERVNAINQFHTTCLSIYPENNRKRRFFDVFRGIERDQWLEMG